jgi:hypothetical protein
MASNSPVTLYRPLQYGRRAAPSKEDGGALEGKTGDYSTPAQDYVVTSGQRDRSPPSPSALCDHPRRPNTIPGTASPSPTLWGTGRQDAATPAVVRPAASRQPHPRANIQTMTKREAPTPPPLKSFLDRYRACHDVPPEARIARTAVYSTALYATPPHVARTVRHACKLPPTWPIKGGAVPRPQGGRQRAHTRTLPAFTTILTLASISTSGTWRHGLLSHLACSPPLQAPRCNAI